MPTSGVAASEALDVGGENGYLAVCRNASETSGSTLIISKHLNAPELCDDNMDTGRSKCKFSEES